MTKYQQQLQQQKFDKRWYLLKQTEDRLEILKKEILKLYINKELILFLEHVSKELLRHDEKVFVLSYCKKIISQYPRLPDMERCMAFEEEYNIEKENLQDEQSQYQPINWLEQEIIFIESSFKLAKTNPWTISNNPSGNSDEGKQKLIPHRDVLDRLKMSKSTFDRRRAEGMPTKKVGKKIYCDMSKIESWMERKQ